MAKTRSRSGMDTVQSVGADHDREAGFHDPDRRPNGQQGQNRIGPNLGGRHRLSVNF